MNRDIIIGIDAGTSLIKAVAFSLNGKELAISSTTNDYKTNSNGHATQSLNKTWENCIKVIKELREKLPDIDNKICLISVTGQGDGTWLIDKNGDPVCDAWLWLDSRSSKEAEEISKLNSENERFMATGTGMFSGQQSSQLVFMEKNHPELLDKARSAFHCKDWLYYKLTGVVATDPSESCFTFGNFRTQDYDKSVISGLGLSNRSYLMPEIINGSKKTHSLNDHASKMLGLKNGIPVALSYIDAVCTFLGSGGYEKNKDVGNSSLGTTSGHMKASLISDINPNLDLKSGYVMLLPIDNTAIQFQTNMSGMINIDWLKNLVEDIFTDFDFDFDEKKFLTNIDNWLNSSKPAKLLYHPYISEAGERGPFINSKAQASIIGLESNHKFPELIRSFVEGLCYAARECYLAMGTIPKEIRLAGGGAKSSSIRNIFSAILKTNIRTVNRKEAGAAGAAMTGSMALELYQDWDACVNEWVKPYLGEEEVYNNKYSEVYDKMFAVYLNSRDKVVPIWDQLNKKY